MVGQQVKYTVVNLKACYQLCCKSGKSPLSLASRDSFRKIKKKHTQVNNREPRLKRSSSGLFQQSYFTLSSEVKQKCTQSLVKEKHLAVFRMFGNVIIILIIIFSVCSTEQEHEANIGGAETLKWSLLTCQLLACPT